MGETGREVSTLRAGGEGLLRVLREDTEHVGELPLEVTLPPLIRETIELGETDLLELDSRSDKIEVLSLEFRREIILYNYSNHTIDYYKLISIFFINYPHIIFSL
jgi:hypothetical protein